MIKFYIGFEQAGYLMKILRILSVLVVSTTIFAFGADAQTRKTPAKRPTTPKVVTTNTVPAATVTDTKSGAEKLSIQIKNVTKFIYALGGIARGIEDLDKEARTKKIVQAAIDQNETNKREVIQAIRNLQAGLATLEVEFRTKEPLKRYLVQIQGITELSNQSEDLARSGRFSESGKPLLLVVEKLSDTLVAMR